MPLHPKRSWRYNINDSKLRNNVLNVCVFLFPCRFRDLCSCGEGLATLTGTGQKANRLSVLLVKCQTARMVQQSSCPSEILAQQEDQHSLFATVTCFQRTSVLWGGYYLVSLSVVETWDSSHIFFVFYNHFFLPKRTGFSYKILALFHYIVTLSTIPVYTIHGLVIALIPIDTEAY
jgi:hypothetical protein